MSRIRSDSWIIDLQSFNAKLYHLGNGFSRLYSQLQIVYLYIE